MNTVLRKTSLLAVVIVGLIGLYGSSQDICQRCHFISVRIDPPPAVPDPLVSVDDRGNGLAAYALDGSAIVRRLTNATEFSAAETVGTGVEEDLDVVVAGGRARVAWRGVAGRISVVDGDAQTGLFDPQIDVAADAADDPLFSSGPPDTVVRSFLAWRAGSTSAGQATTRGYGTVSLTAPSLLTRYAPNEDVDPTYLFNLRTAVSGGRAVAVWTAIAASDASFVHVYAAVADQGSWGEALRLARTPRMNTDVKVAVDVDGDGNALVIWTQAEGLFFRRYSTTDEFWGVPTVLRNETSSIREVRVDVASNSTAVAAWEMVDGGVWAAWCRANENHWVDIQQLDLSALQPLNGRDVRAAIDRHGRARVVWRTDSLVYTNDLGSDGWSAAESLGNTQSAPDLDVNEEGFGVAVWWNGNLQSRLWDPAFGLDAQFSFTSDPIVVGVGTRFDAQASSGPFAITRYEWDWDNDGTIDTTGGPVLSHVFESAGQHTVRLQVTDTTSRTATTSRTVSVLPLGEVTSRVIVNYSGPGDGVLEIRSAQPGFVPVRCETNTVPGNAPDSGICSADVLAGYEVSIAADRDPVRSIFSGWSEEPQQCRAVQNTTLSGVARSECQFLANSLDRTFDVSFSIAAPATEILNIELHAFSQGAGEIYSTPNRVTCTVQNRLISTPSGGACVYSFDAGQTVTVTAIPLIGMTFVGWDGCDSQPSARECRLTMNGPRTIRARFSGG